MFATPLVFLTLLWSPVPLDPPDPEVILSGVAETRRFQIRFRPGSRAEASVDRTMAMVERDLARIRDELDFVAFDKKVGLQKIRLFLYDDEEELKQITGVPAGGFSTTLTLHVPRDNDQTRLHELVHVVAEQLPGKGPEPRNLFFAEGLANAVLEYVHGVPVHAVAAFEKRRGRLPPLAEIHAIEDFYAWLGAHPGVNGYDVAGSYFRFLLDTYGARKTCRYYKGVPARHAFGVDLPRVEQAWHELLDAVELRPGLEALLKERAGEPASFTRYTPAEARLDDSILGPADEWRALRADEITTSGPGEFRAEGDALVGSGPDSSGDWTECQVGSELHCDCLVRVTAAPAGGGCWGVKLFLGEKCQAMLLGQGAFLYDDNGAVGFDGDVKLGAAAVDIVLRRSGGRACVWIDGTLVLAAEVAADPAPVAIGVVQGAATFTHLTVRPLK